MHLSASQTVTISAALITVFVCVAHCAPNSERFLYSMGLGKRVYSPYSFGLGKRSAGGMMMPNRDTRARHVFNFGLGKREAADDEVIEVVPLVEEAAEYDGPEEEKRGGQRMSSYSFGLGKRADSGKLYYSFGLGKRNVAVEAGKSPLVTVKDDSAVKENGRN